MQESQVEGTKAVAQKLIEAMGSGWDCNLCVTSESWLSPWERNYSVLVQLAPSAFAQSWGCVEIFVDGSVSIAGLYNGKLQIRRALKAAGFKVITKAA